MRFLRWTSFSIVIIAISLAQPGCFFYGGVSTVNSQTRASGTGFLAATERNDQWEADGPPPNEGDVTDRLLYRNLKKKFSISIIGASSGDYELSDPYPTRSYRIIAIREVETSTEEGKTVHYYEVAFAPVTEKKNP